MSRVFRIALLAVAALGGGCVGHLEEIDGPRGRAPRLIDGGVLEPFVDAGEPVDGEVAPEPPPEPPPPPPPAPDAGPADTGPARIVWKAAVMAGDNSIRAFDNARETIHGMFLDEGVLAENTVQLSRS